MHVPWSESLSVLIPLLISKDAFRWWKRKFGIAVTSYVLTCLIISCLQYSHILYTISGAVDIFENTDDVIDQQISLIHIKQPFQRGVILVVDKSETSCVV